MRFSAACAMSTMRVKPSVPALPFTECMRRKIESQSGAAGGSCSSRTNSDCRAARCSAASATKSVRYLWEAAGTPSRRRYAAALRFSMPRQLRPAC